MKLPVVRELVMGAAGLALFGTVIGSALQGPFDPKTEMIFVGEKAITLLPPIVVGKGDPRSATWSTDGKWLFLESQDVKIDAKALTEFIAKGAVGTPPATSEAVLTMFDAEKNVSRELARYRSDGSQIMQVAWLPGDRNAAFLITEPFKRDDGSSGLATSLYVASPTSGKVSRLTRFTENQYAMIVTEKSAKGAVLAVQDVESLGAVVEPGSKPPEMHWTATWLGADGRLGSEIRIEGRLRHPFWTAAGDGPYIYQIAYDPATRKRSADTYFLSFTTRTAVKVAAIPASEPQEVGLGFQTQFGQSSNVKETAQVSRKSLWLKSDEKSEQQFALVAAEADQAALSPIGNGIYYKTKGVAMVRPLMSMPKDLALNALNAAERARAISDAKQAALALLMYATDYDDVLPSNAGDWAEAVNPYAKNRDILDGFTYIYSGGPMSDIKNPAETEIGYKVGPGGRAVAYADGHVKWIPDGKKEENLSALTRSSSGALVGPRQPSSRPSFSSA